MQHSSSAETTRATIESSLRECASHWRWIERARRLLAPTFPLGDGSLQSLSERQVELIDQMIYRFTKLQDSIARRLLCFGTCATIWPTTILRAHSELR